VGVIALKIGLVLAGGGCKGAYQIGVWKAFRKLGIDKYIQGVSGTSIGALNAALFAIGDYESAEQIWMGITREKMLPTDNIDMFTKGIKLFLGNKNINFIKRFLPKLFEQGNVSRQGLLDIMNEEMDFNKICTSRTSIYATCTELPEIKSKYFKLNKYNVETVKKILCASSALPPVYGCEEIEMIKYVDGGLVDNVPIQPLYEEGFDTIFIIQLDREFIIDRSKFPNVRIIDIIPSSDQGGIFSGMLDFSNESISKRIRIGYEDTINLLEPIFEIEKYKMKKMPMEIIISTGKDIAKKSKRIADNFLNMDTKEKNKNVVQIK
jgi:NTE family protein